MAPKTKPSEVRVLENVTNDLARAIARLNDLATYIRESESTLPGIHRVILALIHSTESLVYALQVLLEERRRKK